MRFKDWKPPKINLDGTTKYQWSVSHSSNFKLGYKTDIGAYTYINAKHGVYIGDYVQIGSHCSIYSESTIDGKTGPVVVGESSKVGTHSVIMPGTTVGEQSIVGAFSFVNKDIPTRVLAYGQPVRIIRPLSEEELKIMIDERD